MSGWNTIDNHYVDPTSPDVGVSPPLLDSNLVTTAITISYTASDAWNDDVDPNILNTPNGKLMNGTIKSTVAKPTETFQFNNVPEGSYDLYVYLAVDGTGWQADVSDNDGITTYYVNEWHQFYDTNVFVQASNTNPAGTRDTGNYVKFSGLGTYGRGSLGVHATLHPGNGANGTGVTAIELVPAGPSKPNVTPLALITQPISRRGADTGSNVTFTVSFKGPAFFQQWYQNGTAIPGENGTSYTPNPISSATMQNAQISFKATNNLNSITTSNAILTVGQFITVNGVQVMNGGIVNITTEPQSTTKIAVRSGPATFKVAATSGYIGDASGAAPPINYQWQSAPKGSSTFTDITGATNKVYTTPVLQLTDDGTQFRAAVTASDVTSNSVVALLTVLPNTNPPVALAGAITKNDGVIEVGISFDEQVDPTTVIPGNFVLNGGTVSTFKLATNSYITYQSALLRTTGLTPGNSYTVTAHGVKDLSGNVLPSTNLSFTVPTQMQWAEVGTTNFVPGQVIPVGKDGFDILNGGRQEWNSYDEVDMAYVKKTNDFDVQVQVVYVEPASRWTRCGLQARNALDSGFESDANGQSINSTNHLVSAYAQTHVNCSQDLFDTGLWPPTDPVQIANGASNNGHEQNCRLTAGAATTGWGGGIVADSNAPLAPGFPNVWLRLARQGSQIHGYRSQDGVTWSDQGTVTLTDQTNVMYVGMSLGVETGNIWPASGFYVWTNAIDPHYDRLFVGQFRNFGDFAASTPGPTLSIKQAGSVITITFTGSALQESPKVGPGATWTNIPSATSPYTVPKSSADMFFRSRQ
jgi:hypothetical protein